MLLLAIKNNNLVYELCDNQLQYNNSYICNKFRGEPMKYDAVLFKDELDTIFLNSEPAIIYLSTMRFRKYR